MKKFNRNYFLRCFSVTSAFLLTTLYTNCGGFSSNGSGNTSGIKSQTNNGPQSGNVSGTSTGGGSNTAALGNNNGTNSPVPTANLNFRNLFSFPWTGGTSVTFQGVTLILQKSGDLQLLDSNSKIIWHSNTSADCSIASNCSLTLQGDGNFVLYGPSGALWGASTYAQNGKGGGAVITLLSSPPNWVIADGNFNVIFNATGTPVSLFQLTNVNDQPRTQAAPVQNFINMMGINSHIDQNGISAPDMLSMLNYLGVYNIRDGLNSGLLPEYQTLAQAGIHLETGAGDVAAPSFPSLFEQAAALGPNFLTAVEGPNEINNFAFTLNGVQSSTGWPNDNGPMVVTYMNKLMGLVKNDTKLSGVSVFDFTWGGTVGAESYGFYDLSNWANYGNFHTYPGGQPHYAFLTGLAGAYHNLTPPQTAITETGYTTKYNGTGWVSDNAQAIMDLNIYLDAFLEGFYKVYIYELYDEWQTYGVFKSVNNPKPAATAIHNLTTILKDNGAPIANPGSLKYTITGLPAQSFAMLLQKSTGVFDLIIWYEPQVDNGGTEVVVSPVNINVALGQTVSKVSVFDPVTSESASSTKNSISSLSVPLGSHPVILEITP